MGSVAGCTPTPVVLGGLLVCRLASKVRVIRAHVVGSVCLHLVSEALLWSLVGALDCFLLRQWHHDGSTRTCAHHQKLSGTHRIRQQFASAFKNITHGKVNWVPNCIKKPGVYLSMKQVFCPADLICVFPSLLAQHPFVIAHACLTVY